MPDYHAADPRTAEWHFKYVSRGKLHIHGPEVNVAELKNIYLHVLKLDGKRGVAVKCGQGFLGGINPGQIQG